MKQRWIFRIFGITLALLCISCTGFFEIEGQEKVEPFVDLNADPTLIQFSNQNIYSVGVFGYPSRDKAIVLVPSYGYSNELPWVATDADGYTFYLTYYFSVGDGSIPYIPPKTNNASFVNVPITRNTLNQFNIPALTVQPAERLSNEIWLSVKNTGTSILRLINGPSVMPQENGEMTVDPGKAGLYKFDAHFDPVSYRIWVGVTETPLPWDNYDQGYIYMTEFNGVTFTGSSQTELTLNNLWSLAP